MKNILLIIIFILSMFTINGLDIDHGLSLGDVGGYYSQGGTFSGGSILGYRFIEAGTGLGLSVSGLTSRSSVEGYGSEDLFENINYLSLEVNWEPFYDIESFWGLGAFYRVDNVLSEGMDIDWRTGLRLDIRANDSFIYPLVAVEAGYWENHGFYIGIKVDPVFALMGAGVTFFHEKLTSTDN